MLGDLLVDVPRHVVPDVDAAWRAGTTRRRRSYVFWTSAVALVVVLVGFGALNFDRPPPVTLPTRPSA